MLIELIIIIAILTIITSLITLSRISLSKFRTFFDYEEDEDLSFLERYSLKISSDFRNYSSTFDIAKYILYTIILLILNDLLIINFKNYFELDFNSISELWLNEYIFLSYLFVILIIVPIFYSIIEILPKSFSGKFYVSFSKISVIPIYSIYLILSPIRYIIKFFDILFAFIMRKTFDNESLNSEEQIREIIEESTKAGSIEENESQLIDNIFEFKDILVRQVMTPRNKVIAIGDDWTYKDIFETIKSEGYSRYPVFTDNLDSVIGILHTKDIVGFDITNNELIDTSVLRTTIFVKEEDNIDDLLREFQRKKILMAIVKDEFNATSGIITMEDILEEIVGEINDEHDEISKDIEIIDDDNFIVVASVHIRDLNEVLPEELPESDDYESLGGLILSETNIIPELNSIIEIGNYNYTILKRSRTNLEKIRVNYSPKSSDEE